MPWFINDNGKSVFLDEAGIEHAKARGVFKLFKREERTMEGNGPKDKICLLVNQSGIGDAIHAMPGLWQKIQELGSVHVLAKPFHAHCYSSLGATVELAGEFTTGYIDINIDKFGMFYSLKDWCNDHEEETLGAVTMDRMKQFATMIDASLPASFDWRKFLLKDVQPIKTQVVLGLDSTSKYRKYARVEELRTLLDAAGIDCTELGVELGQRRTKDLKELIALIEGAEVIAAVDSSVLAIALALGKPTIAVFGPTDENIIARQFTRYNKDLQLEILRSDKGDSCERPCSFRAARGFGVNGKCSYGRMADCMLEIEPEQILLSIEDLLTR